MIESRLVSRKNELERELKKGVRNPQRKQYILANLRILERDINCLGFTEEEIKENNFKYRDRKEPVQK